MKLLVVFLIVVACVSAIQIDHIQKRLRTKARGFAEDIDGRDVIVTMSYMDEEASAVLKAVLNQRDKFSAVYVIERAASKEPRAMLWERPLTTYPKSDAVWLLDWKVEKGKKYYEGDWVGGDRVQGKAEVAFAHDEILQKLQAKLKDQINGNDKLAGKLEDAHLKGAKFKTCIKAEKDDKDVPTGMCAKDDKGFPIGWYPPVRVYQFGTPTYKANKHPIAIVIRTSEMGMDMGIFQVYNREVMKAIKKTFADKKINFFAIGASGAANKVDCVGRMRMYGGSLFVGDTSVKNNPQPYIAYDNVKDTEPKVIYDGKPSLTKTSDLFENMDGLAALNLNHLREKILAHTAQGTNAMTASYFMGLSTKTASSSVNTHASNTEDFWIIRLIEEMKADTESYPGLAHFGVFRADADPFPSQEDAKLFVEKELAWFTKNKCVARSHYVDALEWASEGMKPDKLPKSMCWDGIGLDNKFFAQGKTKDDQTACILNPLLVEAATDLTKDVYDMPDFPTSVTLPLHSFTKKDAQGFVANVADKLKDYSGIDCGDTKMPVFLRSGWGKAYDENILHAGANNAKSKTWPWTAVANVKDAEQVYKPSETAADRLLYKASNFVVLDKLANTLFEEGPKTIIAYAKGEKAFDKCDGQKR